MEKYVPKSFRQIFAMLLCVAILLPLVAVPGHATQSADSADAPVIEITVPATEAPTEDLTESAVGAISDDPISAQADDGTFTILAGSDFQAMMPSGSKAEDTDAKAAVHMTAILKQVLRHHSIEAFLFGGDYNSVLYHYNDGAAAYSKAGFAKLTEVLNANGLGNIPHYYVQGNHDPAGLDFVTPTGGYDHSEFGVYILNHADYMDETQNEAIVRATAKGLENWLAGQTVGEKPIFVISHVPLHQSLRSQKKGDAQYAKYLVDVLNAAGKRGLNIIFLYSHNHSEENNGYMGGSTSFVARGESIWIPNTAGVALAPIKSPINFTYMNAGFVGWFGGWSENPVVTDDLTMSVFQIDGDDVTITRYSKDGVFPLQEKAGTFYSAAEAARGYTVDNTLQCSPYKVDGDIIAAESGECFYQRVNALEDGKNYVIMLSATEAAKATGLRVSSNTVTLKNFEPSIVQYNSAMPYLLISDPLDPNNAQNESWTFHDPDGDGYGTLVDENGKYLTFAERLTGIESVGAVGLELSSTYTGADIQLWTYVEGINGGAGLISKATTKNGTHIQFIYNTRDGNWDAIGSNFDTSIFEIAYIYERTPLTYTLKLSDKVGEVDVGGTETGSMIVKTWATGQIEYIPVTVNMLKKDGAAVSTAAAGTITGITVTMADGAQVNSDYTLVVGGGTTIALDEDEYGYYYRLTDQFVEGKDFNDEKNYQYLILDRNEMGAGVMMEAQGYSDKNVIATGVAVTLDANGVPAVQSEYVTNAIHQEWWKHKHSDGIWYLWQPNWSGINHNYLRIAAAAGAILVTGQYGDDYALQAPRMHKSGSLDTNSGNYTTINGHMPASKVTMYIQYAPECSFMGVKGDARMEGREVYIYEKVSFTTANATPMTTDGQVTAGSAITATTGTFIQITYPDGRVKTVPVTLDMLYIQKGGKLQQLTAADIANATRLAGLTLRYKNVTLTNDYTLVVCRN